jgi:ribonuclease HII
MEKTQATKNSIRNEKAGSHLYKYEQTMWQKGELICGVDEVGRGSLSGPIVTVAAILNPNSFHPELKDSKKTTPQQRAELFKWSINNCSYSIGINNNHLIDTQNIYKATQTTMAQALYNLLYKAKKEPTLILIDAIPLSLKKTKFQNITIKSIIQGESKSASIAAASIIAKVVRDNIMKKLHHSFPGYKIDQHQGYGTTAHFESIKKHGPSFIHRNSFLKKTTEDTNEQLSLFC